MQGSPPPRTSWRLSRRDPGHGPETAGLPLAERLGGLPVREGLNQAERASRGAADRQPCRRIEIVDISPAPRTAGLFHRSSACRGRLGVRVRTVTDDLAERFRLDGAAGVPAARVWQGAAIRDEPHHVVKSSFETGSHDLVDAWNFR